MPSGGFGLSELKLFWQLLPKTLEGFYYFMKATFDGLEWDIEELPNGSSSADDMTELTYAATTECPNCGSAIFGTAHFLDGELSLISYDECECEEDDDTFELDEDYELKSI